MAAAKPVLQLLLVACLLRIHCTNSELNESAGLEALVRNYTLLEPNADSEQHRLIISEFTYSLGRLRQSNSSSRISSKALISQLILGVYKARSHAIKYSLSSNHLTVTRDQFELISGGSTDLLSAFLASIEPVELEMGGAFGKVGVAAGSIAPLDLAVQLGMLDVLKLLIGAGMKICPSLHPLHCTDAVHYATMNQDMPTLDYLIETVKMELSVEYEMLHLCELLTSDNRTFGKSPLDIAYFQCSSGLNCDTFEHIMKLSDHFCGGVYSLNSYPYMPGTCTADSSFRSGLSSDARRCGYGESGCGMPISDGVKSARWHGYVESGRGCDLGSSGSGHWRVYGEHRVGRMDCDLPRVPAGSISPEEFKRNFVELSTPVVLTGLAGGWPLVQEWRKDHLLQHWRDLDVLVGAIPYGEVFGEMFGYATISEFIRYMDGYAMDAAVSVADSAEFRAPLYIFDNELLQSHFKGLYNLEGFNISSWKEAPQYPQFILGPAGSGAPFHFHCHALNALIYGRKKWFLYPPSDAIYSKEHPRLWFKTKYSTANTKAVECVQRPGDILYVPSRWTHATINLDECVGLALELDTGDC